MPILRIRLAPYPDVLRCEYIRIKNKYDDYSTYIVLVLIHEQCSWLPTLKSLRLAHYHGFRDPLSEYRVKVKEEGKGRLRRYFRKM
jgi:hypothetical protein